MEIEYCNIGDEMKHYLMAATMLALALGFLINFILIAQHGRIWIGESNPYILYAEITGLVGIICWGIYVMVVILKQKRNKLV